MYEFITISLLDTNIFRISYGVIVTCKDLNFRFVLGSHGA